MPRGKKPRPFVTMEEYVDALRCKTLLMAESTKVNALIQAGYAHHGALSAHGLHVHNQATLGKFPVPDFVVDAAVKLNLDLEQMLRDALTLMDKRTTRKLVRSWDKASGHLYSTMDEVDESGDGGEVELPGTFSIDARTKPPQEGEHVVAD
jgi:hypothetical protein